MSRSPGVNISIAGPLKSPLKWAGGKRWLVPHIRPLWEAHRKRRFVEPLCGGLAMSIGLMPEEALLNDINPHAINFYRWVKQGLQINLAMENSEEVYYSNRERFNHLIREGKAESKESAELFYFLNKTGYNGLCRFNRKGEFNVPFGKHKQIKYAHEFSKYERIFARWQFTVGDFERMPLESEDFVYADPPYDVEFTQYAMQGFEWEDQVRLVERLAKHTGPVVLSNQATDRIIGLYEKFGFELKFLDAPRMISCNGDRTPAKEVLAIKGF